MKINAKINLEFEGEINGIKFFNKENYLITLNFLESLSEKFKNIEITSEFIEDFSEILNQYIEYYDVEEKLEECIGKAKKFENLHIIIDEDDEPEFNAFKNFNEKKKKWRLYKKIKKTEKESLIAFFFLF